MIRVEQECGGAAVRFILNRPKANILDAAMIGALREALPAETSGITRLVIFEGAGDHFSFGASVEEHQAEQVADMLEAFHGLFRELAALAIPTCAVVRGQCLGGGLELASWCTWIVATPDASLGQPEIRLGVFPPMASILLPWRAGGRAALDLCVTGRSVGAQEALELGIVNAVVDDPDAWWRALVSETLLPTSGSSLRYAERAARRSLMRELEGDLAALEHLYVDGLMKTRDANEGIAAFLKRRKPIFTHHG